MLSYRKKILISYLLVFLLFIALIFPFASKSISKIVSNSLEDRATELIAKIQTAPNDVALVRRLKEQKPLIFFRVSIINHEHRVLYDTHMKRLLGPKFSQEYIVEHPEVRDAFENGIGYSEEYSDLLGQKFIYFAKSFDFQGKKYVMRTAFPYKYVMEFTQDFEIGFLIFISGILLLFSIMTWSIILHLSRPIQQIITAIKPYQEGRQNNIPDIVLKNMDPNDDFGRLAHTLNSLSQKIQSHIDTLIAERNEKEAVLQSLIEGVVAIDDKMTVVYANNMALKLLNITREELLHHNFKVANLKACDELLQDCQQEGKPLTTQLHLKHDSGKVFLDVVAAPKKDQGGAILVLQDKSMQYKLLEMRKDFVANASHELKTPITIIQGFAETLHDHPELPRQTCVEITNKIMRNCQKMTTLIRNLLTLADIENLPPSRLVECDLSEILEHCCDNLLQVYPQASIKIVKQTNKERQLLGDPDLVELAIMNLLVNAAKYSHPPAEIMVTLQDAGEWVKLAFADKGLGIPEKDLENICQRFYTVDKAHSRKLGGSGLGLSIVETIMEKHLGKITIASTLGEGSTFTLSFPAMKAEEEEVESLESEEELVNT